MASHSEEKWTTYCDSEWAGCPNTRLSTSGFYILLAESPTSWKAKRQCGVSRSTTEAEYRSMVITVCEVMWLKKLLEDLGMKYVGVTHILCDNQETISINANLVYHEKEKQFEFTVISSKIRLCQEKSGLPMFLTQIRWLMSSQRSCRPIYQHNVILCKMGFKTHSQLEEEC